MSIRSNGTEIATYADGKKVTLKPRDYTHTEYPDGTAVTEFASQSQWPGQTKTEHPDGKVVLEFASGQKQTTYRDGTKETVFEDGTKQTTFSDGKHVTGKTSPAV